MPYARSLWTWTDQWPQHARLSFRYPCAYRTNLLPGELERSGLPNLAVQSEHQTADLEQPGSIFCPGLSEWVQRIRKVCLIYGGGVGG